jgi:hypothetical protein
MRRYDKLTERLGQIESILALFSRHLRQDQEPRGGYNVILEDIHANPNADERTRQLLQMEELMGLVNSDNLSPETLTIVTASLNQKNSRLFLFESASSCGALCRLQLSKK